MLPLLSTVDDVDPRSHWLMGTSARGRDAMASPRRLKGMRMDKHLRHALTRLIAIDDRDDPLDRQSDEGGYKSKEADDVPGVIQALFAKA
jgi:hypothetical protein